MNRRERRAASARGSQTKPTDPGAASPAALCKAGVRHRQAGRHLDAQVCCQHALALDSDHADTLHLTGLLALDAKQYDHAVAWIARAIRKSPQPEYLSSLGTTLQRQGRLEDALQTFDKAVQLKPDDAELWKNLGNVLSELKRPADAVLSFQHALKLDPQHWDAAYRAGFSLHDLGRSEEALEYFDLGARLQPNLAVMQEMRGVVLHHLRRYEEALAANRLAHALDPDKADTCNNIGATLQFLCRDEEALAWFDRALKIRPDFVVALSNKAASLQQMHRFDEAVALYNQVKTIDPLSPEPEWNLALLHLVAGNFEAGWTEREARWRRADPGVYPKFQQPRWFGEGDIAGKTILICADEGLGDIIQFARYVPMVAARGARVILVVDDPVYPLLSGMPGAAECFSKSDEVLPPFDLHCPMSGLPLAFATRLDTIPDGVAYLPAAPEARVQDWERRLGPHDRLRVGLVWSGNPLHKNDHNRSIRLRTLSRILDVDATFVSLQKEPRPEDKAALLERTDIVDLTADLTDFAETAALVNCLDLVISVDTSVAHLAAALGRPTWILLPYEPDYRWLRDRDDSPWYPTARLFRQGQTRDYDEVLDRIRTELTALMAAR